MQIGLKKRWQRFQLQVRVKDYFHSKTLDCLLGTENKNLAADGFHAESCSLDPLHKNNLQSHWVHDSILVL